ncbi:hypothetical protein IHQ56_05700 [Methylobacillus flagellatus]|uniref:hypothetical protein n=1 Tax=Methylobacillus flagellatus TaxID=405 RepID=UPI002853A3C5|nr:hypothetical protein [Methylobacillus flagellatus]MDR5171309.1 hypothetical protein [Methylobacillus flagellatus]
MKSLKLKLAVLGTLGLASAQVMAGWVVNLPAAGYSVTGGTTAYTLCNPTGNFGSGLPIKATPGVNDDCAVFPTTETTAPDSTYPSNPVFSTSQAINMNNTYTNNTTIRVGTLTQYLWRKTIGSGSSATYECIYGTKIVLNGNDYNLQAAGTQNFEVNDIAVGGFGGKTIDVAYSTIPTVSEPVYRVGRTFTAVQHRGTGSTPAPGYVARPLTTPAFSGSINGVNSWSSTLPVPTAAQQSASLNDNWVNFTTDVNFLDDDGSTSAASGMVYVRTSCSSTNPTVVANAVRLRQTFQELSGDGVTNNWFIEVPVNGFLPTLGSGVVTPTPSSPF